MAKQEEIKHAFDLHYVGGSKRSAAIVAVTVDFTASEYEEIPGRDATRDSPSGPYSV
jgi:hypothetical protein